MVKVITIRSYRLGRKEIEADTILLVSEERARILEREGKAHRLYDTQHVRPDEKKSAEFIKRVKELP